jgi:peptidoglycan DL-endopeptidase LytF
MLNKGGFFMDLFNTYKLHKENDEYTLILYLSPSQTEFASELFNPEGQLSKELNHDVEVYVKNKFPRLKIKLVKVMMGSIIVASIALGGTQAMASETTSYTVASGDSLSVIAKKFNTTTDQLKSLNSLTSDIIYANQILKVPSTSQTPASSTTYTVVSGDSLSVIAKRFTTTVESIRSLNNLTSDTIFVGQTLKIPSAQEIVNIPSSYTVVSGDSLSVIAKRFNTTTDAIKSLNGLTSDFIRVGQVLKLPTSQPQVQAPAPTTYRVIAGDTLWSISRKFNTTVDNIKSLNSLGTDTLYIGQVLNVPTTPQTPTPTEVQAPTQTQPSISYVTHRVASGENAWNISLKYGIPMPELLRANNLPQDAILSIGQELRVPVHTVPVMQTPGPQYGENLDWWTAAQYVFPIGKTARVIDFKTGRSFNVKRTIGANHSDTEPLTSADSAIIKEIWGGSYSWATRAVIVEVDGRRIAASMASMPHSIEYIKDNNFDGHFDIHFLNSTRHNDGTVDPYHQAQIKLAAGIK